MDPWAPATSRGEGGSLRWLLPLSAALLVLAMTGLMLVRTPGNQALQCAAELLAAAQRLEDAVRADSPGADLAPSIAAVDSGVAALQAQLLRDAVEVPAAATMAGNWAALRGAIQSVDEEAARASAATLSSRAAALLPAVSRQLDERRADLELALKAMLAVLALALLLPMRALWRQRRQMRSSLRQFSGELRPDTWRDAVNHLRDDALGAPSAFDALASGVEGVLGESERRWQALADLSADWYWETDRHCRLSWLSASAPQAMLPEGDAAALLGRRHDQIAAFNPPAIGWAALHERMARLEPFRDLEFQVGRGRQARWLSISGRARLDAGGMLAGYEGVGRDISERRVAHERLIASEQRWSMMARLAADWYWQTDAEHRLLPLSAEQHQRIGAALADRIEGRTRWDAHHDALTPPQWAEHRADLDARRPFRSLQFEVDAGDGRFIWISLSGLPRYDAARRFVGYHGVGRDITTRKQAERLLLRHNEELQRAVEERTRDLKQLNLDLDAFARQLAHELRTPIGQVQGLARMLSDRAIQRLTPEDKQLLELQLAAAQHMRDTVDALMSLARSTLQPMPLQRVDLSLLARQVRDEVPAQPRRGALQWQIQDGMIATGNPAALRIVLSNLMGNAAKFSRDREAPRVVVSMRDEGETTVRVAVEDNGVGFDTQRAALLFRPFSRLHARDDYSGSGIGLSIVQRIVERHGGSVAAHARPEGGARFEFTLARAARPAADPDEPAVAEEERAAA